MFFVVRFICFSEGNDCYPNIYTQILHAIMAESRGKFETEKKSFGVTLRRFRIEGLRIDTVNEMACRLGVSKDIYANWELGRSSPEPFQVIDILNRCPPEFLREFGLDISENGEQDSRLSSPPKKPALPGDDIEVTKENGRPFIDKPTRLRRRG